MNLHLINYFRSTIAIRTATVFLVIAAFLAISSKQNAQAISSIADQVDPIDRVHEGDVIDIHVSGYLDYDWRGSLTPEGFLDGYERIGKPIYVRCKTTQELALEIEKELSATLRSPKTEVRIVDRSKRALATVDGAIRVPQRLQLRRMVRLSELIVKAGGFTDRASGQVIISRPPNSSCVSQPELNTPTRFDISISDILAGRDEANPIIVSGDLIVVIEASSVYLLGAIQNQGRLDYRPALTVSRAIDAAGGALKDASLHEINIFRRDGGSSVIPIDLSKIRDKKTEDVTLRPFDIIDIPFKGKPPRKLPPVFDSDVQADEKRSRLPIKIIE